MRENASEMQQYTDPSTEIICASRSTSAMMGEASAQQVSKSENRIRKYPLDAGEPVRIEIPHFRLCSGPMHPLREDLVWKMAPGGPAGSNVLDMGGESRTKTPISVKLM